MQLKYLLSLVVFFTIIALKSVNIEARDFKLKPLSASDVYKILKDADREDVIPEGRAITQGLTALTQKLKGGNFNSSKPLYEICFQSRSLQSDDQERSDRDESEAKETTPRSHTTTPSSTSSSTTTTDSSTPTTTSSTPTTTSSTPTTTSTSTPTTTLSPPSTSGPWSPTTSYSPTSSGTPTTTGSYSPTSSGSPTPTSSTPTTTDTTNEKCIKL